ncbi:MAG TPA: oligopeptide/dipeptide ABC transporter ATP-binding protein [Candidatus Limnocylindrales bacterium]|nr:oligopeptide/dipeptide ABC transporter ATP-binding protein [Candidatus Limnocylindrales bacterium]
MPDQPATPPVPPPGSTAPGTAPAADAPTATAAAAAQPLVKVEGLVKYFPVLGGVLRRKVGDVKALDGVTFDIQRGEILGVVGESGCGKTTLGRTMLYLQQPTAGRVVLEGEDLSKISSGALRRRRSKMQIIFQDPYSSLNPRMPVYDIIGEGLQAQGVKDHATRTKQIEDSLEAVGLRRDYTRRYPHEFSGGQRQRIGIARALALNPAFIVCDEAVSALDVSIQSQILNLLSDLRQEHGFTYLFIAHNLSVIHYISDRVAVMYLGRVVELAGVDDLYERPRHPYTVALMSAVPEVDARLRRKRIILKGDVPSPVNPPSGCHFHPRCWLWERLGKPEICTTADPTLTSTGPAHLAACHFADRMAEQPEVMLRDTAAAAGGGNGASVAAAVSSTASGGAAPEPTPSAAPASTPSAAPASTTTEAPSADGTGTGSPAA